MNSANVPPTQIVEVLRYVPVALTTDNAPQFVQFVQQQTTQGITGPALVPVVVQQLQTFYPAQTQVVVSEPVRVRRFRTVAVPQTVVVDQNFVPPVVIARMGEHPHGGPPGQLKKQLGLQTGAEVVHGEDRGRTVVVAQPQGQAPGVEFVPRKDRGNEHGEGNKERQSPMISSAPPPPPAAAPVVAAPPGQGKQKEDHGDQGKGGDKGKGKGHGKD
jgi:hypothetical protein